MLYFQRLVSSPWLIAGWDSSFSALPMKLVSDHDLIVEQFFIQQIFSESLRYFMGNANQIQYRQQQVGDFNITICFIQHLTSWMSFPPIIASSTLFQLAMPSSCPGLPHHVSARSHSTTATPGNYFSNAPPIFSAINYFLSWITCISI